MKFSWGILGRDFWFFRSGQVISVIGDSCGGIAFAWWILDATGSAAKMASVLAPAMFFRLFLLPLFGPLGDKFPRKWLIIIGDLWRGILTIAIVCMVYFKFFNLPLVIAIYILLAIGSALFNASAVSIVPQLVTKENLKTAMQQEQAIMAGGNIIGGIVGGVLVSVLGVAGAFLIDACSYFIAALFTFLIKANTKPIKSVIEKQVKGPIKAWYDELREGLRVLVKIPVELWLAVVAASLNFVVSPIEIALPILVKEVRNMPPWFYGGMQSSISVGTIIGALIVGYICKKFLADYVVVFGIMITGLGIAIMPWVPNPALPLSMMFFMGVGLMLANIPLSTQTALAIPDEYRARIGSLTGFLCQLMNPIGLAFAGVMITGVGLSYTMLISGLLIIVLSPLMFLIPNYSEFFRLSPNKAAKFYIERYPEAFKK